MQVAEAEIKEKLRLAAAEEAVGKVEGGLLQPPPPPVRTYDLQSLTCAVVPVLCALLIAALLRCEQYSTTTRVCAGGTTPFCPLDATSSKTAARRMVEVLAPWSCEANFTDYDQTREHRNLTCWHLIAHAVSKI